MQILRVLIIRRATHILDMIPCSSHPNTGEDLMDIKRYVNIPDHALLFLLFGEKPFIIGMYIMPVSA